MTFLRTCKPGLLLFTLVCYVLLMVGLQKLGWRPAGAGVDFIVDSAIGLLMGWVLRSWEGETDK